jgi:hypothetical protein
MRTPLVVGSHIWIKLSGDEKERLHAAVVMTMQTVVLSLD